MATFAVSVSAQNGNIIVFSSVASVALNSTFFSLFEKYNKGRYDFISAHVAGGPNGPWQDVEVEENLDVLGVLNLRHILYKVAAKEEEVVEAVRQTDAFEFLMGAAKQRGLPKRKAEGGTAKDKLYNAVLDSLKQKGLDFPHATSY